LGYFDPKNAPLWGLYATFSPHAAMRVRNIVDIYQGVTPYHQVPILAKILHSYPDRAAVAVQDNDLL
jgi:hypothetical protein